MFTQLVLFLSLILNCYFAFYSNYAGDFIKSFSWVIGVLAILMLGSYIGYLAAFVNLLKR
jgi:hypothetical protein